MNNLYIIEIEKTCIIKDKYKLNNKTGIKIFSENILYLFIFNKITNSCFEKIEKYYNLILMSVIYIPKFKKRYERKRLRPYGKWYFNKNKI